MKQISLRAALMMGAVVPAVLLLPGIASASGDLGGAHGVTTPSKPSTSSSVEREIGKTGWHYGFETTVDDVTATPKDGSVELEVDLTYRSMAGWRHTPADNGYLEVDGEAVDLIFDSPEIPGEGKASGSAKAVVKVDDSDEPADLDDLVESTVLVYGETNDNQTKIPFAADGDASSIKPRDVQVSGAVGDSATVELRKASLWPSYTSGDKDRYELWLQVKASAGNEHSFFNLGREHLALGSPDGKSVGVDSSSPWTGKFMSRGQVVEFEEPIVFMVDKPATGDYTLTFTDPVNKTEDTIKITL